MTETINSWDEILSAAESELVAFENARELYQQGMVKLRYEITNARFQQFAKKLDKTDSTWDILIGVGIMAAGGGIVSAATRLALGNLMRGWAVLTTVRTLPIVIGSTSETFVSGMTAAQMLANMRRSSVMKEISTKGKPLHDVNENVVDLLTKATTALAKHGLSSKPDGQPPDRSPVQSSRSRPDVSGALTPAAAALLQKMAGTDEQDRFTMELQDQYRKAKLMLEKMRTIIHDIEQDADLDAALRKEWLSAEKAVDKLAGSNSNRIPPGTSGPSLDVHIDYLRRLYAYHWTNTAAFLQFGPTPRIGSVSPDAYKLSPPNELGWQFNSMVVPNRIPPRPNWWSMSQSRIAAYRVGDEFETDIAILKSAAVAEGMITTLRDPETEFKQTYLDYAGTIIGFSAPVSEGSFSYRVEAPKLQNRAMAAKDQAFQRMFRDMDETWTNLRLIPAGKALLDYIRDLPPIPFPFSRSIRDELDRKQQ